jgi:DNA-binding MurR/RpiR family transcriptional regulator
VISYQLTRLHSTPDTRVSCTGKHAHVVLDIHRSCCLAAAVHLREAVALEALETLKAVCVLVAVALAGRARRIGRAAGTTEVVKAGRIVAETAPGPSNVIAHEHAHTRTRTRTRSHTHTRTHARTRTCGQMQRSDALIALHITGATSAAAVDRLNSVAL